PFRQLAKSEAVTHRQRTGADETLPTRAQPETFGRTTRRIRPVEHPYLLSVFRGRLEHVTQRGNKGVDAAAQVLQVDEQHVEAVHHRRRGPAYLAVQAVHR